MLKVFRPLFRSSGGRKGTQNGSEKVQTKIHYLLLSVSICDDTRRDYSQKDLARERREDLSIVRVISQKNDFLRDETAYNEMKSFLSPPKRERTANQFLRQIPYSIISHSSKHGTSSCLPCH